MNDSSSAQTTSDLPGTGSCPACGAHVPAQSSPEALAVCPGCGALRVWRGPQPTVAGHANSAAAIEAASLALTSASVWRGLALAVAPFAVFSALVVWLVMSVADPPEMANVVAFMGTLVPLGFAGFAWTRWRARASEVPRAVEHAWHTAVLELVRARQSIDTPRLVAATQLSTVQAAQLLGELARANKLVADDAAQGITRYTLADGAAPLPD